ncbi:MAG TPA: response regulator [Vicinamibacterales bacterium]|nr:response regulator [Vicinamibacterales bacterium]
MATVLIVDDEEQIRLLLRRWLQTWGYDARVAVSAADALAQLETTPASIVLCDVIMPVHDGLWLTDRIRERWPDTAVIMASGAQDIETVKSTRRKGAVDFVPKPFGREQLRQALERAAAATAA